MNVAITVPSRSPASASAVSLAQEQLQAAAAADLAAGDILGARLSEALERLLRACIADRRIRP